MEPITIDIGVNTALTVDLSEFNFDGIEKVVFTIKNYIRPNAPVVIERELSSATIYEIIISPEESLQLREGAVYDFDKILLDGRRYKNGENGKVLLRFGVGDSIE